MILFISIISTKVCPSAPIVIASTDLTVQPPQASDSASLSGHINIPTEAPVHAYITKCVSNLSLHESEMFTVCVVARTLIRMVSQCNHVSVTESLIDAGTEVKLQSG